MPPIFGPAARAAPSARAAGRAGAVRIRLRLQLGQLLAQRRLDRPRHVRRQVDLLERVAIAFEQPDPFAVQREHLVAVRRLHQAQQRLDVKAVGDDDPLGHLARQPIHAQESRVRRRRRDPPAGATTFRGGRAASRSGGADVVTRRWNVGPPLGLLDLLQEVAEAHLVPSLLGKAALHRHVDRHARRGAFEPQQFHQLRSTDHRSLAGGEVVVVIGVSCIVSPGRHWGRQAPCLWSLAG